MSEEETIIQQARERRARYSSGVVVNAPFDLVYNAHDIKHNLPMSFNDFNRMF